MAAPLWTAPLFNKAQIIDSSSSDISDMEMQTWKAAARHSSSSGLERGIITDFAKRARSQLIRALDFLVCGAINEPHLPADGSIPNQFLCVRCDQKVLDTRKHELWECPGNTLINHTHMKESVYLTSLAQEFWDTDKVLFARGLLPRDWLLVSEPAECNEVKNVGKCRLQRMRQKPCVVRLGRIREEVGRLPQTLRQVAFGVATFDMHIGNDTSFTLQQTSFLGGQVPGKQTVPRAELWGAIQILSKVDGKSNIQTPIDAKYVTRGIAHRGDLVQGPNGDLWLIFSS